MANTLTNFLIGIGYDYDTNSEKQINSGFDRIATKGLAMGGVLAGAFGLKEAVGSVGNLADGFNEVGKLAERLDVDPKNLVALGGAFEGIGAEMSEAESALENVAKMRAGLLVGDAGWIAQAGKAGIDSNVITDAATPMQAFNNLAPSFQAASPEERMNMGDALGLSNETVILLSKGSAYLDEQMNHYKAASAITGQMVKDGAAYAQSMSKASASFEGLLDRTLAPSINVFATALDRFTGSVGGDERSSADAVGEGIATVADGVLNPTMAKADANLDAIFNWVSDAMPGMPSMPDFNIGGNVGDVTPYSNWASPQSNDTRSDATPSSSSSTTPAPINLTTTNMIHLDGDVIKKTVNTELMRANQNAINELQSSEGY